MTLPPVFIQRRLESGVRLNRSQSLDHSAGPFPATFDPAALARPAEPGRYCPGAGDEVPASVRYSVDAAEKDSRSRAAAAT